MSRPQSVATNALAMSGPSSSGLPRFASTWVRDTTVPMMPTVGAKPPRPMKNALALRIGAAFDSISSSSRIRSSSPSVPSAMFCRAFFMNGSSCLSASCSSASRPLARAVSANPTTSSMTVCGGVTLPVNAFGTVLNAARASFMVVLATPQPMVATKTRSIGAGRKSPAISTCSICAIPNRAPKASRMPTIVAMSTVSAPRPGSGRRRVVRW